jgi:hypothetical protein
MEQVKGVWERSLMSSFSWNLGSVLKSSVHSTARGRVYEAVLCHVVDSFVQCAIDLRRGVLPVDAAGAYRWCEALRQLIC